jgi:hypothetical protein
MLSNSDISLTFVWFRGYITTVASEHEQNGTSPYSSETRLTDYEGYRKCVSYLYNNELISDYDLERCDTVKDLS